MVPAVVTPHVWLPPALTLWKVPAGGLACPEELYPQHWTVPDEVTPHVWLLPALTLWKVPAGGLACPE